ncbi:hypothetical protein LUZ61_018368 [Rhynchospora tenuis]|uniref:Plant heme peroxidase family profile domain-containing protein n=1 Tax=Rhynchospora tenuis TaxID=198213 RepID=A0AAD5Z9E0_9POAL|nr:hypothetical protein LUZ61_018368 [Rhynchospora tenuis]
MPNYYDYACPQAIPTIRKAIRNAIANERRMAASLIRLHFHDCFVQGCDGSVLLKDTPWFTGEQTALQNNNSIRGMEIIDAAKQAVRLFVRESSHVQIYLHLQLETLPRAHTVGQAQCVTFRNRIYNETNIDPGFAIHRRCGCPSDNAGNGNLAPLDPVTPYTFDNKYYKNLMQKKGLLHSDQVLFNGGETDGIVAGYSRDSSSFYADFAAAMVKMGDISPLTGSLGQIRKICSAIN